MSIREDLRSIWIIARYNLRVEIRYPLSYASSLLSTLFWFLAIATVVIMFSSTMTPQMLILGSNLVMWGLVSYIVFGSMISEVGFGIVRLQMRGTLEHILLSPITFWTLPMGLMLIHLLISMLFVTLTILLMTLIFEAPILVINPLGGILGFLLLLMMSYGMSMLLAGLVIKMKRASWALLQVLQLIHMIFCGVFYPFSNLPSQVVAISRLLPLSYAIDIFRTTLVGINPELIGEDVILLGYRLSGATFEWILTATLSITLLVFGYIALKAAINDGRRKGYLGQY